MSIDEKDLHKVVWPFKPWKDARVVNVPLTHLKTFIKTNATNDEMTRWVEIARAEMTRRHSVDDHTFITEHAFERFSQWFPDAYPRYMRLSGLYKKKPDERPGLSTFMKALFKKALHNGQTTKAVGNSTGAGNYHVKYRHFRWTYGLYGTSVKQGLTYEYKLISVVPTNNGEDNPFKKKS